MAKVFPLYLSGSGQLANMVPGHLLDWRHFTHSGSVNGYTSSLPDTLYVQTASADVDNPGTATPITIIEFNLSSKKEKGYFLTRAIVGSRTATAAQEPRIGLTTTSNQDALTGLAHASSLTALQYRFYGSLDAPAENTAATTNAAANTNYPDHIYGITEDSNPNVDLSNKLIIVAGGGATVTADAGTTYFSNEYFGFSSSLSPIVAPLSSLHLSGSRIAVIKSGDTIDDLVLPPTGSLWVTQSLSTNLTNNSSTVYTTIFTLTGLVDGVRYLVNCYLAARSGATTTAVDIRTQNGDNHCGTIWTPETATTYEIRNSADGTSIVSEAAVTHAAANADRLMRLQYTFTKQTGVDHLIQFKSETGTQVQISNYSLLLYKRIDTDTNQIIDVPVTLSSGSITSHTQAGSNNKLRLNSGRLPTFSDPLFKKILKTTITSTTATGATTVDDLEVTFQNSRRYYLVYYLGCSSADTGNGVRIGVTSANLTTAYTIEAPTSTTALAIAHNATPATANSPASDVNNYYLYKIYALVTTNASGTPTFAPTLASEAGGTEVRVNDSLLQYIEF
jgi:hypothetical protein